MFAAQIGAAGNDFVGITGEHYEQAGDEASAAEYHARTAEHAKTGFAHDAAPGRVRRALTVLDKQHRALQPTPCAGACSAGASARSTCRAGVPSRALTVMTCG